MNADRVAWQCAGASALGSSHRIQGLVNQDAIRFEVGDDEAVVAVADGHGSARCFRSDRGARLAVELAVELGAGDVRWFDADVTERPALVRAEFVEPLVAAWHALVLEDARDDSFTDEELLARGVDRTAAEADPLLAYGTTLLVAVTRGPELVLVQIGDGDLVVATNEGVRKPVPLDERLAASATTSLADPAAAELFRVSCGKVGADATALVLLATDGYGNSFADPAWAKHVAGDLLGYVGDQGLGWIDDQLGDWLIDSAEIAGDDVTVALLCRAVPAGPAAYSVRTVAAPASVDPGPMPMVLGGAAAAAARGSDAGPAPSAPAASMPPAPPPIPPPTAPTAPPVPPSPAPPSGQPRALGSDRAPAPSAPSAPRRSARGLALGTGLVAVLAIVAGGVVRQTRGGSDDPTAAISSSTVEAYPSTTVVSTTTTAVPSGSSGSIIADSTMDALGLAGRTVFDLAPLGPTTVLALLDDGTTVVLRQQSQPGATAAIGVESTWTAPERSDVAIEPKVVGAGGSNRWAANGTTLVGQTHEEAPATTTLADPAELLAVTGDGVAWTSTVEAGSITSVSSPGAAAAPPTPVEGSVLGLAAAGDRLWVLVETEKRDTATEPRGSSTTAVGAKPGPDPIADPNLPAGQRTLIAYQAQGATLTEQGRTPVTATGIDLAAGADAVLLSANGATTARSQPGRAIGWSGAHDARAVAVTGGTWWVADQQGASVVIVEPT